MSSLLDILRVPGYGTKVKFALQPECATRSVHSAPISSSRSKQLAEAMDVSRQTINSIEKERWTPSLPLAIALARFFDKTVEEIFHADGNA